MTPDPDPAELARQVAAMKAGLPEGGELVIFLIFDQGANSAVDVFGNQPPEEFSENLRGWLERYDAGETRNLAGGPDA